METLELPKRLRTLEQIERDYQGVLKACSLRAEFRAGRLKGFRPRASCNAPILICDEDLATWLHEYASARAVVLSPSKTISAKPRKPKAKAA